MVAIIMVFNGRLDRLLLSTLLLLISLPGAVHGAEFLEFYKLGLQAAEARQWNQAAEMMQKAIDKQPRAKVRVKRAMFFRRYLPHFYLGQALYESGSCERALAAWEESESQGVVTRFPEFKQLQEGRIGCSRMVDLEFALDEALRLVEMTESAAVVSRRRLSELSGSDAVVEELLGRQSEAEATLGRARLRLDAADIVLGEVEQTAAAASLAREQFEAIQRQAESERIAQLEQLQGELSNQLAALVQKARKQLRASEFLRPYPPAVARRRSAVEQALEHAKAATGDALDPGEMQAVQSELAKATRDLRQSITSPPAELKAAAEAYLARDYSGVLTALAETEFSSARAASHAHLLQAAALFSLYQTTGASDDALLVKAREEVLACNGVDPQRSPPPAVFSPSFIMFFESHTLEPATPEYDEGVDEGL